MKWHFSPTGKSLYIGFFYTPLLTQTVRAQTAPSPHNIARTAHLLPLERYLLRAKDTFHRHPKKRKKHTRPNDIFQYSVSVHTLTHVLIVLSRVKITCECRRPPPPPSPNSPTPQNTIALSYFIPCHAIRRPFHSATSNSPNSEDMPQ